MKKSFSWAACTQAVESSHIGVAAVQAPDAFLSSIQVFGLPSPQRQGAELKHVGPDVGKRRGAASGSAIALVKVDYIGRQACSFERAW